MATLEVDGKILDVEDGTNLLRACLTNGIYIPNLCYLEDMAEPAASCRMCFVEIEGFTRPVPSCTMLAESGMKVRTDTPAVRRLQRTAFQLLLSVHQTDCKNCPANKRCALQYLARFLSVGLKRKGPDDLTPHLPQIHADWGHPFFQYEPRRCILCGKCVHICKTRHKRAYISFAGRGFNTLLSFYGMSPKDAEFCKDCRACVEICPVGALWDGPESMPKP